ncbi:MAG: hypothetical protein AAGA56_03205 [Myxococcota bacterium]
MATRKKKTEKSSSKTAAKAQGGSKSQGGAKKSPSKKATTKKSTGGKKARASKKGKSSRGKASSKEAIKDAVERAKTAPSGGGEDDSKRSFGLRGAAPWVARHAAKHAEELRKRNAQPAPPGSARATLRTPDGAEEIKSKVAELHNLTSKVRTLRKKLEKNFFEIGELLAEVQLKELFEAKGFSSFESFLDREIDLPRTLSLRLVRISHTFQRETAYDYGLDRLTAALAALDGETVSNNPSRPSSRSWSSSAMPPKPPLRYDD